jgi:hypothetical protein
LFSSKPLNSVLTPAMPLKRSLRRIICTRFTSRGWR